MKCPHCNKEVFGRGHNVEGLYEEPKELTPLEYRLLVYQMITLLIILIVL